MYMYICIYVYMYAFMHACMHACMYIYVCVCMCIYVYIHTILTQTRRPRCTATQRWSFMGSPHPQHKQHVMMCTMFV